jgi:hypothetical protein
MRPWLRAFWQLALGSAVACGSDDRPPPVGSFASEDAGVEDTGALIDANECSSEPPLIFTGEDCDNVVLEAEYETINLYFVVDRSASMEDRLEGGTLSKYDHARIAIRDVLRLVGHRVRFGAAVFPALNSSTTEACQPGTEVFPTRAGDPPACVPEDGQGPVLTELLNTLAVLGTEGWTPTAATLENITPILTELSGRTTVVLATDGGPNCNPDLTCTAAECQLTVEGAVLDSGEVCGGALNCCDPDLVLYGNYWCIDAAATEAAVAALAEAGISTYVIGMPGSEAYASDLSRLAEVGGTARGTDPSYYSVGNTDELSAVLMEIGTTVAFPCDVHLTSAPFDPLMVRVLFDGEDVLFGAEDGWTWANESNDTVQLNGASCADLQAGRVQYVQIVVGCPTIVE